MRTRSPLPTAIAAAVLTPIMLLLVPKPGSAGPERFQKAPRNPAFVRYVNSLGAASQAGWSQSHALGYVPTPLDLSYVQGEPFSTRAVLGLPSRYDMRERGLLPPVRDQGSCGSCWAFASYGSLESCTGYSGGWPDFSEMDMLCHHGFDWDVCDGGNVLMSMAYLARWSGPKSEGCYPYNPAYCPGYYCPTQCQVQDVSLLAARKRWNDNAGIKNAVMKYGGVMTAIYWDDWYFRESTSAYYCPYAYDPNHAVCIVGWDDKYLSANFYYAPKQKGAFICRSSWGSGWGEGGYFYMSYCDAVVGHINAVFKKPETTASFAAFYHYDPLGWVDLIGANSTTAWFANVFVSEESEYVAAASWYSISPNSAYALYVYLNPVYGNPRSGKLLTSQSGTISEAGYHTVRLKKRAFIPYGCTFSVVVKLTTPGCKCPVPVEYADYGYSSDATADWGESYVSTKGKVWYDVIEAIYDDTCNVCLKAFMSPYAK